MKVSSNFLPQLLKYTHDFVTLVLLAFTLTVLGVTLSTDKAKMPLSLTNTFYTTYYTNYPALTWSQPTDPVDNTRITDTFYNCLHVAGVGTDPATNCADLTGSNYVACLKTQTTAASYLNKRVQDFITRVSKQSGNYTQVILNFPAFPLLDGSTQPADVQIQFGLINTYLADLDTPFSREMQKVMRDFSHWQGIAGCIDHLDATAGILSPITSIYDHLWQCASEVLPTTKDQAFAFQQCVPLSAWPALDELQSVYSSQFLGSYNGLFVLIVVAWIVTSFAVFTLWLGDSRSNAFGKPRELLGRTGIMHAGFCFIWNAVGGGVLFLVTSFQSADKQHGLPMTLQTVLLTGLIVILASGYFAQDFWEQLFMISSPNAGYVLLPAASQQPAPTAQKGAAGFAFRRKGLVPLAGYARISSSKDPLTEEQTAPLVVFPWSDVWLLTDAALLVVVMGTSPDVVTAEVGRVFLAATYTAAAHSAFVRLFYEAHYSDAAGSGKTATAADQGDKRGICIMLFFTHMAIVSFAGVTWWLLFQRYVASRLVIGFVVTASIIPTFFWLLLSVLVENGVWSWLSITTAAQLVFIYNAVVRAVFFLVVLFAATATADTNTTLQRLIAALET